ncbi:hypothetical protein SA496_17865 [Pseudomonas sp. JS3066]|jgi:hypothetical protein|uniref:hypothetical protein n=1 Tax=unclassified Pseudomonas TaxID=196821 RepID=UPI000EAA6207|nr:MULTISPECIES: hypothetical protein [unclassified Pseudomonas]AYF85831.1 hypothetical protein D6Z43_01085 [Pseudomonas sp. DY-1]MDH4655022.1 hypothetical protein [Pseudomonas sp. BN606]MRK19512.1 hypothetical protein [Pseudomonas sp. JG-B]WVK91582.1 hypothetical protein SA496_17865 [Pseudomonas sp. JS3066]
MRVDFRHLVLCCLLGLLAIDPAHAADVHLRGHWQQFIDEEDSLVGVLSRDEEGDAVAAELHLQAYRNGVAIGEEVHRFALPETVRLFAIPLEDDVDCYRVLGVIGLDAEGERVSTKDDSPSAKDECDAPESLPVGVLQPI